MEKACNHSSPSSLCEGYKNIKSPVVCPDCGHYICAGCGSMDPDSPLPPKMHECPLCKGEGKVTEAERDEYLEVTE